MNDSSKRADFEHCFACDDDCLVGVLVKNKADNPLIC